MNLRIAFIGSRKLAEHAFENEAKLFYQVAYRCAELGIILRSGAAGGADVIAETAYRDAINAGKTSENQIEIFVPWKPFQAVRGINNPLHHLHIMPSNPTLIKKANEMVQKVHPAPERLSQGALKLHSRNMNQVFGLDLKTPIQATICWTEKGAVVGGTATALKLSMKAGIPIFNLGRPDQNKVLEEIRAFLLQNNVVGVK